VEAADLFSSAVLTRYQRVSLSWAEAADLFARDKNIAVLTRYQRVGIVTLSWVEAADLFARDKNIALLTRYQGLE
jgi:hypothetical protein